jgi:hypothetical protein
MAKRPMRYRGVRADAVSGPITQRRIALASVVPLIGVILTVVGGKDLSEVGVLVLCVSAVTAAFGICRAKA